MGTEEAVTPPSSTPSCWIFDLGTVHTATRSPPRTTYIIGGHRLIPEEVDGWGVQPVKLSVSRAMLEAMVDFAREQHPLEVVLLLRGGVERGAVHIDDFLVPPLAVAGESFAEFPVNLLPIDFSIMGTAHSHPTGVLAPSTGDLNNFYGRVMIIIAHPYTPARAAAFNAQGAKIPVEVVG